jgi:2-phospho-L-lactate guanylyltransferase
MTAQRREVWALVPAKAFAHGKSRLKPALSDSARAAFAKSLFDHVLGVLQVAVDGVLVCTDSAEVAEAALARGARVRRDRPGTRGLAAIVDGGLEELAQLGATGAVVLMADQPRLTVEDVRQIVAPLSEHDMVLVRAQDGHHTNALALSPPDRIPTAFGRADSFEAHLRAAQDLRVCVLVNPRVAFDVDGPEDHAQLLAAE